MIQVSSGVIKCLNAIGLHLNAHSKHLQTQLVGSSFTFSTKKLFFRRFPFLSPPCACMRHGSTSAQIQKNSWRAARSRVYQYLVALIQKETMSTRNTRRTNSCFDLRDFCISSLSLSGATWGTIQLCQASF